MASGLPSSPSTPSPPSLAGPPDTSPLQSRTWPSLSPVWLDARPVNVGSLRARDPPLPHSTPRSPHHPSGAAAVLTPLSCTPRIKSSIPPLSLATAPRSRWAACRLRYSLTRRRNASASGESAFISEKGARWRGPGADAVASGRERVGQQASVDQNAICFLPPVPYDPWPRRGADWAPRARSGDASTGGRDAMRPPAPKLDSDASAACNGL